MILETDRLILSWVQVTDTSFILKLLSDTGFIQNIRNEGIKTAKEAQTYINQKYVNSYQKNGFGLYRVTLKSNGEHIGICGIVKRDALKWPDIGYAFLSEYCGKGFASESAIAVMDYGNRILGIERIVGITSPNNQASIKVLEKVGLVFSSIISIDNTETMLFVPN